MIIIIIIITIIIIIIIILGMLLCFDFSLPANTSAMTGRPMGGLSPGAMLDLPNHQPNQFLKPRFPTSGAFFCVGPPKNSSVPRPWARHENFAAGKRLATQMGRVCPGCTNYEPLKFPGLAKILHGICSESWGSPQKTTLFGWNRTSRKVRFVELSSCTGTRRGFADGCRPRG